MPKDANVIFSLTDMDLALRNVRTRIATAAEIHGAFANYHEAYAVLLEEVEELWAEIKKKEAARDQSVLFDEAIDVAAVSLRIAATAAHLHLNREETNPCPDHISTDQHPAGHIAPSMCGSTHADRMTKRIS